MARTEEENKMAEVHQKGIVNLAESVELVQEYGGKEFSITYRKQPLEMGFITNYYAPFQPGQEIIDDDILYDRDFPIKLKDGRTMYVDIYRPKNATTKLPIILAYTPFGKRHWHGKKVTPALHQAMGVPKEAISEMAAFEAPDPSYWCRNGYAVVNADAPGCGYSEGNFEGFNTKYGVDGANCVEELAKLDWCNGKIGMGGNSGLAVAQWFIAAQKPEHLACIAPWEGLSDFYRESCFHGGIPFSIFVSMMNGSTRNNGYLVSDEGAQVEKYPLMNEYWADRIAKTENIKIPAYVTAGYSHPLHLRGTVRAFMKMRSRNKWIRFHREFEWPDFNNPKYVADLKLFYDRYLKDIHNGWELVPKVRVQVMDAYDYDYCTDRPENEWPIARTQYKKFFLNAADMSMTRELVSKESQASYDAKTGDISFDITFSEETEITGHPKLKLWIEADGSNDMDLFVYIQKIVNGKLIPTSVFGEDDPGTAGKVRVSKRELDEKESTDYFPVLTHTKEQLLSPGEIVPVEFEINPTSRIWHKGETMRINIAGRVIRDASWFFPTKYNTRNQGIHIVHTGGKYDSFLQVPIVPPKYVSGDYEYRTK